MAQIAKTHLPFEEQSRKESKTNTQFASYQQNYSNNNSNYPNNYNSECAPHQNYGGYGSFRDKRADEEEWRANPAFRETPTMIQELADEHLGHKLVSSQVEEFPNEDPVAYWARKQSDPPAP